jgi:hypothetical protein
MSDGEQRPLSPKGGCEECQRLHNCVESARLAKSYLINGAMTGYRSDKSRSRQYKEVRDQMNSNDNAERLARARLRMHEIQAHEGFTDSSSREFKECMDIEIRRGRDRA